MEVGHADFVKAQNKVENETLNVDLKMSKKSITHKRKPQATNTHKLFMRRLTKWCNSSDRGNINLETHIHSFLDGTKLLSLRQRDGNKSRKSPFGDMLVFHSNRIDDIINHLQNIKNQIKTQDLVVDEVDLEENR